MDHRPGSRTIIISDTHLGRPGCGVASVHALRPLWQGADHLIVNGDVAELADDTRRAEAARHVLALQELCDRDGVALTLLAGNHDPMVSDARHLWLHGGAVLVTHGDAVHPAISPWTAHRDQLLRFHDYTLRSAAGHGPPTSDADELRTRLAAAQYAAHFTWDDWHWHPHNPRPAGRWLARLRQPADHALKVARVLWYWHTLPRDAAAFARRFAPQARFFVFGHIHRAGIWHARDPDGPGRTLINTGSYSFPGRPLAVALDADRLAVFPVVRRGDAFELAPAPKAAFDLPPLPAAAATAA